ncbi:ATP-binding cassette domain-containing protein [Candidatus Roizmanbacteria bacterium]|nr:ATP-binding cassette domain-containing protein [Candidatus Roizmanbacteria bacterium]
MISLSSVTKRFGDKVAINKVTFTAKEGEIIGFLGPNGAGKTTTMRLILGYLAPTEGKISINKLNPIEERIHLLKEIGYLPENNPLYQEMKVSEYLQFIAQVQNVPNFSMYIQNVGIEDVLSTKIEELSRGYKQRVGLAAAFIGDPEILVLDEPTSGLDPLEQEKIRMLIKSMSKKKTVIFSTHILSEVEAITDRLIIIDKGRIVYDGKKLRGRGGVEKLFRKLVK